MYFIIIKYILINLSRLSNREKGEYEGDITWAFLIKDIFLVLAFLFIPIVAVNAWDAFCVMTRTATQKHGLLNFFTGKYLHPQRCTATFHWSDPAVVGNTVSFVVQRNGRPYPISNADGVVIEITQGIHKIGVVTELGGETSPEVNTARCKFTARRAGLYSISILLANQHIKGSPFLKRFLPGPPDNSKIAVVQHSSTVVCTTGVTHHIFIEPRDSYLNLCLFDKEKIDLHNYSINIKELEGGWDVKPENNIIYDEVTRRIKIDITLQRPGCYVANVSYCNSLITNGKFEIIVLTEKECSKVQKTVARRSYEGYEARLLAVDKNSRDSQSKAKKVYCYVTPKQLILKEFLLKVIPKRLLTFRLCPSTKFVFEGTDSQSGMPTMSIDDGCQPVVRLACKDRNVVCATFSQFMLKNIGGSETFKDKQEHFYHELRRLHSRRPHDRLPFTVSRQKLLESTLKATKGFTVNDWCRSFEVTFQGEEGIDWGGLRREFFELLCVSLFDSSNELFSTFHEEPQAPVHPNPFRPKHLKLKHYEFAGRVVGKCLYESALGGSYRQSVKARFTRSFLAQLIGLRVHYKHFSHDDPSLYSGKVLHLLNHGTEQLEEPLYFTDEFVVDGECKVIELEPGGSSRLVTDESRSQYLDALAQYRYRLAQAFIIFRIEILFSLLIRTTFLLMCGIEEYSIADLKAPSCC
ncbi:Apoptosis-resistant E3 ubiquitin protein ligase 1 [Armadillidium nasatum]|uniref:HECT-type E3 ubiquitin transferase n=1 Tax=Armadillidium nasatum TaxID=96803 RepID=A0A5N5T5C3_9CRUS|nr:Apoptosis-resistant E3 ubiquitin protein ligase 1 [Armadillidium nasatum]